MLSNNRISFVKSLHQKKKRREHGLFLAEGDKLVREYLQSGMEVEELYAGTEWLRRNAELFSSNVQTFGADDHDLSRITTLVTPPPVIALVRIPEVHIAPEECFEGYTLLLDGIRDPGNLGTIIRTADWFGIQRIVASDDSAEQWNPKVVQSSMGSLTRVRVINAEPVRFIADMQEVARKQNSDVPPVYGAFMNGENVYSADLTASGIIVIGNEASGIREATEELIDHKIGIPNYAQGDHQPESLNAAIATALVLAEFRRRTY